MTASTEDIVGAALAGIDQTLEWGRTGCITPETLIDRVHGYQRTIAGAGAGFADVNELTFALISYEAGPLSEGAIGRLMEGFAAYRLAVHGQLAGMAYRPADEPSVEART